MSRRRDPFDDFKSDELEGQQIGDRRERFMRGEEVKDPGFQRHAALSYAPPPPESPIRRVVRRMMVAGLHR